MLLVVRHADAGDKRTWDGPDRLLRIETVPGLGVDATPAQLLALVWDLELQNAVQCTHGEGIGLLLTRLLAGALVAEDPLDWPKGSTWLLERGDQSQVRGRFLGPLVLNGELMRKGCRRPRGWIPSRVSG
jgi:hypothetical protein